MKVGQGRWSSLSGSDCKRERERWCVSERVCVCVCACGGREGGRGNGRMADAEGRREQRRGPRWAWARFSRDSLSERKRKKTGDLNHDPIRPKIRRMHYRYCCRAPNRRTLDGVSCSPDAEGTWAVPTSSPPTRADAEPAAGLCRRRAGLWCLLWLFCSALLSL